MAYQAALVVLDARVLFSPIKVSAALDPALSRTKATVEEHHLFPKAYLATQNKTERKQVNQIANFALLEWPDNLKVGAAAPADYAPALDAKLTLSDRFHHALPQEWWGMAYESSCTNGGGRWLTLSKRDGSDFAAAPAGNIIGQRRADHGRRDRRR